MRSSSKLPRWIAARLSLVAALSALAVLALACGSASAVLTHGEIEDEWTIGSPSECVNSKEVAVDETRELVYVVCQRAQNLQEGPVIKRFHYDGSAAPFEFEAPYISGNEITGHPLSPVLEWNSHQFSEEWFGLAVNNSSVNNGLLLTSGVCDGCGAFNNDGVRMVVAFRPSGEFFRELQRGQGQTTGVAFDPDGNAYVTTENGFGSMIRKFAAANLVETERLFPGEFRDFVAPDATGAVWAGWEAVQCGGCPTPLRKFEADAFSTDLTTDPYANAINPAPNVEPSPYVSPTGTLEVGPSTPRGVDVDSSTNNVYAAPFSGNKIEMFTSGSPEEYAHKTGPNIGEGTLSDLEDFDLTDDGRIFASTGESRKIYVFGPGEILPDIRTPAADPDLLGHTTAVVTAHVERDGGSPIVDCQVEYGLSSGAYTETAPCSPDAGSGSFTDPVTDVSVNLSSLAEGQTYYYRFKATNEEGSNFGGERTFVPPYVLALQTEGADVDLHSATLHGSFDPDGIDTTYWFQYGSDTSYGLNTAPDSTGVTSGKFDVSSTISSLPSGRTFHYRLVAENENGVTVGQDRVFRTASTPEISGVRATDVTATSAVLNARIDPVGYDTKYRFEYGTTPDYGSSVPVPDGAIKAEDGETVVSSQINGLQEGVTYHFRIWTENTWGENLSDDTTFDFAPPACPNEHARQQTGTPYLPDCRAYELVSQEEAGAVYFFPSTMLENHDFIKAPPFHIWTVNRGEADSPSRFSYYGALGSPAEVNAPNSLFDMYLATRTSTGWVQNIPGLKGDEALYTSFKECSDKLDLCLDRIGDDGAYGSFIGETAPYLFDSEGNPLGQLPSNVNVVKGGKNFTGDQRPSYDFSHYVFSSNDALFTTDGVDGSGAYPGSAYDNDIKEKTVRLISRLPGGEMIPKEGSTPYITFPAISTDGSHILMATGSSGGPSHLYMTIDQGPAIDVSRGAGVSFVGMTKSGSRVFFVASQQLTTDTGPDDTDTSADLYMWESETDSLSLVSVGNGNGNSNSCSAGWVAGCGVAPLQTERESPFGITSVPGPDDELARKNGAVFFYSPELLDPASPGVLNQRNLYIYRNGTVKLVGTLDPGTQINRIQISADGSRAGFVTGSRLTGYDNRGYKMMYTYNADTGAIRCASCRPDGLSPRGHVAASQGGPFMADDGRVFFATADALVPQDGNGNIVDVYEFVDGRPQLISSGEASRDTISAGFFFPPTQTGLESVSRDGTDVFFSTFDTLVPEDNNGPFVKFYDARSGGGFDFKYQIAPCEAADECHGVDSSPPPAPQIATRTQLGASGNVATRKRKSRRGRKRGKRSRKGHRRHGKRGARKRRNQRNKRKTQRRGRRSHG